MSVSLPAPPNRFALGRAPLASLRVMRVVAALAEDLDQRRVGDRRRAADHGDRAAVDQDLPGRVAADRRWCCWRHRRTPSTRRVLNVAVVAALAGGLATRIAAAPTRQRRTGDAAPVADRRYVSDSWLLRSCVFLFVIVRGRRGCGARVACGVSHRARRGSRTRTGRRSFRRAHTLRPGATPPEVREPLHPGRAGQPVAVGAGGRHDRLQEEPRDVPSSARHRDRPRCLDRAAVLANARRAARSRSSGNRLPTGFEAPVVLKSVASGSVKSQVPFAWQAYFCTPVA